MSIEHVVTLGFWGSDGTKYIPVFGFLPGESGTVVSGPYYVAAKQAFVPGAWQAQTFLPGAKYADGHVPGAVAAQGVPT